MSRRGLLYEPLSVRTGVVRRPSIARQERAVRVGAMVDGATDLPVELKLEAYSFSETSLRLRQDGRADGGSGDQA